MPQRYCRPIDRTESGLLQFTLGKSRQPWDQEITDHADTIETLPERLTGWGDYTQLVRVTWIDGYTTLFAVTA